MKLLSMSALVCMTAIPAMLPVSVKAATSQCIMASQPVRSEMIANINAQRAASQLPTLSENQALSVAAQKHACDMLHNRFFDHRGSDGSNSFGRAQSAGFEACIVAENIAWGPYTIPGVATALYASAGHRANILHPRVREVGFGYVPSVNGSKAQFVQVFGKAC